MGNIVRDLKFLYNSDNCDWDCCVMILEIKGKCILYQLYDVFIFDFWSCNIMILIMIVIVI